MAELIHNRYELIRQIGEGGMGKTFLARDRQSGTEVVVKILHLARLSEWKVIELFEREAETLKNIAHPFIPDYIDYFTDGPAGDRRYFLVQEYIRGKNLKQLVEEGKRFREDEVREIAVKLFSILTYLQELRPPVVHRDINPKNVIVNESGDVYLVDFGAVQGAVRSQAAGGSTVVGTYGYMPMEQLMGKACPASDVYAVGVTLLFLLSHKNPEEFPIANLRLDYRKEVTISPRFSLVLDRLIEPDLAKRISNASQALVVLSGRTGTARPADQDGNLLVWDATDAPIEPPFKSRITTTRTADGLEISIPGKILSHLPLIGFALFWFGFLSVWTLMAGMASVAFSLFSIPFWIAGGGIVMKTINGMSRAVIRLTPTELIVKRGALFPKKVLPLAYLTNVAPCSIQRNTRYRTRGG
ncbi:MAG TPA: serine/threonine protein kinase, partial [Spirochaetia bacterium]|nr:serine/threonine protein kinase [Spirochaetia bacterium]